MVGKKNFGRREVEYGRAASPGKPGPPAKPVPAPLFDWRRVRPAAIAVFGCFISLSVIGGLTWYFFPQTEHLLLMASFGSSAILIFTGPEIAAAQPWPAVAGHVAAALVGVFVRENIPWPHFAALALAVSASLFIMLMTRSLHPPAGGTAIMALNVDGALASYGYWLAAFPMAAGMIIMVALAMVYNNIFSGRRYPRRWQ